jgi:fucose permease
VSSRRRLAAATLPAALLALASLGLRDGSLGVAWPSMRTTFHQPLSSLGLLLLLANAGYLLSSATSGRATRRLGAGPLLAIASTAAATALAVYCIAGWWPLLLGAAAVLGLANGAIDAGVNAHVALHHSVRAMGLIHASYGVGATAGPILVAGMLGAGAGWQPAFAVLLAIEVALALWFWTSRPAWTAPGREAEAKAEAIAEAAPPGARVEVPARRALLPLSLAVFFVYTGVELATGAWAFSLLTLHWRLDRGPAGAWVASYWGALTAGRVLLGLAGHRTTPDRVLRWSTAAALVGALAVWWHPSDWIGGAGLPLLGAGLAAVFPTLVSLTPARHGAGRAHAVIGYQLAAASIGGSGMAALAGVVADQFGLAALGPFLAVAAAALLLLVEATAAVSRRPQLAPSAKMS